MVQGLGNRLRYARENSGMSMRELARQSGFDSSAISKWERGKNGMTDFAIVCMSQALNVSGDWLLGIEKKD